MCEHAACRIGLPVAMISADVRVVFRQRASLGEPPSVLVEADLDAGLGDRLQLAEHLVAVAPAEARRVAYDQRLERWSRRMK